MAQHQTTPVLDKHATGTVVYVAGYAGGVFALDADTGTQAWSNPGVLGVSELVLWSQPEGSDPPTPARRLLLAARSRSSGVRSSDHRISERSTSRTSCYSSGWRAKAARIRGSSASIAR